MPATEQGTYIITIAELFEMLRPFDPKDRIKVDSEARSLPIASVERQSGCALIKVYDDSNDEIQRLEQAVTDAEEEAEDRDSELAASKKALGEAEREVKRLKDRYESMGVGR